MKILVVDDEAEVCNLIAAGFRHKGHSVEVAYGGEEALRKLTGETIYDAMVLDLRMPGVDGIGVLQRRAEFPATEIFVLTAYPSYETAVEALRQGAADYLEKTNLHYKPVDIAELVMTVTSRLGIAKVGPFEADMENQLAFYRGEPFEIPHKLFDIYVVFLLHPDKILNYMDLARYLVADERMREKYADLAALMKLKDPVRISEYFKAQVSRLRNEVLDIVVAKDGDPLNGVTVLISRPRAGFYWNPKVKVAQ